MGLLYVVAAFSSFGENGQQANDRSVRALGTALEWPEAQKRAVQVREWGIKVREMQSLQERLLKLWLTGFVATSRDMEQG